MLSKEEIKTKAETAESNWPAAFLTKRNSVGQLVCEWSCCFFVCLFFNLDFMTVSKIKSCCI